MLGGGLLFFTGFLLGRVHRPHRKIKEPKPVCGCKHHYSMHDKETGHCHGMSSTGGTPVRDRYGNPVLDRYGDVQFASNVPCGCRRYAGPEPLPTYTAELDS